MPNIDTARFAAMELLDKGWSSDKKFIMTTHAGERQLLRVSDRAELARKRDEFEMLRRVEALGVPASRPLAFWTENDCVCQLLSWVEGESAEDILPTLPAAEQYALGLQAGEILRKIHSIPAPDGLDSWDKRYLAVMEERFEAYRAEGIPFDGSDAIMAYLDTNKALLGKRPQSKLHGDYHTGNMIVDATGKLHIIDWHFVDFDSVGDPWTEFSLEPDIPAFSSGIIDGYWSDQPPDEFWKLSAYYIAAGAITAIVWARYWAPEELDRVMKLNAKVVEWYDCMTRRIPTWYHPPIPAPPTLQPIQSEHDIAALSHLAQTITREYFTPILGKENAAYCADHYCTPAALAEEIANGNAAYFIVHHAERVGYMQYRLQEDCLFIDKLYLLPADRRRGMGAQVIRMLEEIAISSERPLLRLEANKRNTAAIAFYERVGFAVAGECEDNDGSVWDTCFMQRVIDVM